MNFNSILIGTDNAPRLIEYYTRILGAPGMSDDTYAGWQVGSGFVSVGPHSEVHGRNATPGRMLWNIESTDVKGDFERFKAAGATVVKAPYEFEGAAGSLIATFEDPDGNYFQLMTRMEM
jgi:predicted enzyme related to lactoylglutathione lyase